MSARKVTSTHNFVEGKQQLDQFSVIAVSVLPSARSTVYLSTLLLWLMRQEDTRDMTSMLTACSEAMFFYHCHQMLAIMIMFGKIPARLKVRNLFDLFDLDFDGNLNSSETVLMLRFGSNI